MTFRASALAVVAPLLFAFSSAARAEPLVVTVIVPRAPSDSRVRALHRLESELDAAGFSVVRNEPRDRANQNDELGCEVAPAFSIVEEGAELTARLCQQDRSTGRSTVWRVGIRRDARADPEAALAIRAVEVLRANLVPSDAPPAPSHPLPIAADVPPRRAGAPSLFAGVFGQAGVGAMRGWPRLGPTVSPVLRVGYGSANGWAGRLTFAGLGSKAKLQNAAGIAEIDHQAALVELVRALLTSRSVQPYLAIGAGVYHASVVGTATAGYLPGDGSLLALVTEAEAGVALRFSEQWSLTMGFAGWITFPALSVRLGDEAIGGAGRPLLLASIGVSASYDPTSP